MRWEDSSQMYQRVTIHWVDRRCYSIFKTFFAASSAKPRDSRALQSMRINSFWTSESVPNSPAPNSAATCKVPIVNSHALILSSSHRLCRPRRVTFARVIAPLRAKSLPSDRRTGRDILSLKRKHRNSLHRQLSNSLFSTFWLGWRNLHPPGDPRRLCSSWCRIVAG